MKCPEPKSTGQCLFHLFIYAIYLILLVLFVSYGFFFVVVGRMLSSLTPAHAVSVMSYLSHCERVCVCVCVGFVGFAVSANQFEQASIILL